MLAGAAPPSGPPPFPITRRRAATPAVLDAEARVPWGELVDVVNLCKRAGIERVEFALPPAEWR